MKNYTFIFQLVSMNAKQINVLNDLPINHDPYPLYCGADC